MQVEFLTYSVAPLTHSTKILKWKPSRKLLLKVWKSVQLIILKILILSHHLVGRSHAKKQIKKRAYVELRIVIVEVLSDMCKLDDDGNNLQH